VRSPTFSKKARLATPYVVSYGFLNQHGGATRVGYCFSDGGTEERGIYSASACGEAGRAICPIQSVRELKRNKLRAPPQQPLTGYRAVLILLTSACSMS